MNRAITSLSLSQPSPSPLVLSEVIGKLVFLEDKEIRVTQVRTHAELENIADLRRQINLSAVATADPHFFEHEKKEMKLV